jgi:hypothetical protein
MTIALVVLLVLCLAGLTRQQVHNVNMRISQLQTRMEQLEKELKILNSRPVYEYPSTTSAPKRPLPYEVTHGARW